MRNRAPLIYLIYCLGSTMLRSAYFAAVIIYYVTVVGLDPFQLVLVGTTLMITVLLAEVPTGVVADLYSRRLSVVIGTALTGAGFLIEASFANFVAVLLSQVVWGLGLTFTSGALEAWAADEAGDVSLERLYIRGGQLSAVGELLGIGVGVGLATFGLRVPLYLAGAGLILFALALRWAMPERHFTPRDRAARSTWGAALDTARAGASAVRASSALRILMWVTFFFAMASESFDRLWQVHFLGHIPFPSGIELDEVTWFGLISAVALLLSVFAGELVQRRLDRAGANGLLKALLAVTALIMLGMIGFGLASGFGVGVAMFWLAYLLRRVYMPLYVAWLNQHAGGDVRATVNSLSGQIDAIGQIAGGPLFGLLASAVSTRAAMVLAALTLIPALLAYLPLLRRPAPSPQALDSTS